MEKMDVMEVDMIESGEKPFSFENIRKETTDETFKCWNKLLKSGSVENVEYFNEILSPNVPLSPFEEKLRLILIDTFQLKDEAIKVFLSRDDYSIKRILKCKWFFRNLSVDLCTTEIFPKVSASVRYKIINKLSRYLENEEEAENFFTYIAINLDKQTAEMLLPKCSSQFILNYWKTDRPLIDHLLWRKERILYKICLRYPETCLEILSMNCESKKRYNTFPLGSCKTLLRYLAGNHTDLFIPFFKKHVDQFYSKTFSAKLTKKLIKKVKDFIFESKLITSDIFNKKSIFLQLDSNDQIRFLASMVTLRKDKLTFNNWYEARYELVSFLKCIQPSHRYSMIKSVFKKVYNLNFEDQSKCWSSDLLELLPGSDRKYFAENIERYYESSGAEYLRNVETRCFRPEEPERVIYLYEFNVAFEKFKDIITKTSDKNKRQNIITCMVKCCQINKDSKGLDEVVDFITTRHRNEDPIILFGFSNEFCNTFPEVELNTDTCEKLLKLLLFCTMKGFSDTYSLGRLLEIDIYLHLENNKNVDDLVKKFFEHVVLKQGYSYSFLTRLNNQHSRTLLLALGKEIQRWIQTHPNNETSETLHGAWINTCEEFNKINKKNEVFLGDLPGYGEIVKMLYKTKYDKLGVEDWPLDTLETCSVRFFNPFFVSKTLQLFLKKNPSVIAKHFENVFEHVDQKLYPVFAKKLNVVGATNKLKEITLNKFQTADSNVEDRIKALKMYSHLCTIEEFTNAVQEYIPEGDLVQEEAEHDFTRIQLEVPKLIWNIRPRWKNLNLIVKFFRGDFLKQVIYSFYSCCYHSSIDFIIPFLKNHLSKVPQKVSHTKDIIKLICMLSTHEEKINFCLVCWDRSNHYSIRSIILRFLSKSFFQNPTRYLMDGLVECVLQAEEIVIREAKPDLSRMPDQYVSEYAMILWKCSKKLKSKDTLQREVVNNFNLENIGLLLPDFCEEIITENLLNPNSVVSVESFTAFYCAASPDLIQKRVIMVLTLMKKNPKEVEKATSFFNTLRSLSVGDPEKYMYVISVILLLWPQSPGLFEQKIIFTYFDFYYRILLRTKDQNIVSAELGKQLRAFYSNIASMNDLVIILIDTLKEFIEQVMASGLPFLPLVVAREVITGAHERALSIIVIQAMPACVVDTRKHHFSADGDRATLNEIIKILERKGDDILWIYFKRKFKTAEIEF